MKKIKANEKEEMKKIMASNITFFLSMTGRTQRQMCKDLGFKENTVSDWINEKTYPRIDKIEKMAVYFDCNKSQLIEKHETPDFSWLSFYEIETIFKIRQLNSVGRDSLSERLDEMLQLEKYTVTEKNTNTDISA